MTLNHAKSLLITVVTREVNGLGLHLRFFLYHINGTHEKWHYTKHIFIVVHSEVVDDIQEDALANDDPANGSALYNFLYPDKELLPEDKEMTIFDHLEELRDRIFVSVMAVGAAILGCFVYSKDLIMILEAPVRTQGVRFLQLAPGEFFFTTIKVTIQHLMNLSPWLLLTSHESSKKFKKRGDSDSDA